MSDELPDGWQWRKLGSIAAEEPNAMTDGPFGSKLKTEDYSQAGVRVIRLGNIGVGRFVDSDRAYVPERKYAELRKHEVFPGDLLIAALADPVGRCCEVPGSIGPAIVKADCVRLKVAGQYESRFVMYWLNSPAGQKQAELAAHGMGRLRMNMSEMRALEVPLPPTSEQRRIVAKLDALTARSRRAKEALDAVPALLERLRQSVLAAAFRGDLTADWRAKNPDVEPASELLKRIRVERRRRWEEAELAKMRAKGKVPGDDRWKAKYVEPEPVDESELPELPEGWCWASVDEVTTLSGGITKGQKRRADQRVRPVPYLRVANVQRGYLSLEDVRTIDATEDEIRELRLVPGDILLNEGGDRDKLGRGWVWSGELPECIHQNHVFRARPMPDIEPRYVSSYVNAFGQAFFIDVGKQTTNLASISMSQVRRFPVALAPAAEQRRIAALLQVHENRLRSQRRLQEASIQGLNALNSALLAKAFRGELAPQDPTDEPATPPATSPPAPKKRARFPATTD